MSPLEKAARAAWETDNKDTIPHGEDAPFMEDYRNIARAVLMAIREPGDIMHDALGPYWHDASDTFQVVIDAILAQDENKG